ncbi:MAG: class 1 fructose-bisphosphatase [Bacteroidetes bacterium]|nr:MAG: class 1 fructose-bisphosphatase [Bacteroidota bacterium]
MSIESVTTLGQFIINRQKDFPFAKGEFTRLMADIGIAAKTISREVRRAGIAGIIGVAGNQNVQGEEQQKLDVMANRLFIECMKKGGEVCVIASEEDEDLVYLHSENADREPTYVVAMDPLDGSSNIDVNVSIGTIFSVYKRISTGPNCGMEDALQPGVQQVAAGYVLYGSSTMLVYTAGREVNGFTLDPSIGEFCLSHPNIQIPKDGKIYSLNEGSYENFPQGVKDYIDYCKEIDKDTKRPYSARYIGSMVADFHRNMLKGGIFIYPATADAPNGKLRLLYECNPLAFIAECAGGRATTGYQRIMEIQPEKLHQRTPIFIGSENMVKKAEEFMAQYANASV